MIDFFRAFKNLRRFRRLPESERRLVFYAEDASSWSHFGPVIEYLTEEMGRSVTYVTSSASDPVLELEDPRINALYVGSGTLCTSFFLGLDAAVVVLTMPDLETYHLKRSRVATPHYVYIFHSMVSTHMIYREHAFDHYDTIFAVGPHHLAEIRATEKAYGLEPKNLVEHGYPRLDEIREVAARREESRAAKHGTGSESGSDVGGRRRILIAPSWGPEGLLETCGSEWIQALLDAGHQVTLRPHPETGRRWPEVLEKLRSFEDRESFRLETDIRSQESFHRSHLMISDWSGVALEYAFGLEKPVLFVDVPRKVNNEAWRRIDQPPVEDILRTEIGEVVATEAPAKALSIIERLCASPETYRRKIRQARDETVFHLGESARVGAEALDRLVREQCGGQDGEAP